MLPMTESVYDFRTELREDSFTSPTGVGVTCANVTLGKPVYDDDTGTVDPLSDLYTDTPVTSSYNTTSRQLLVCGLTANTTRILTISYDVDALEGFDAIELMVDKIPFIWILLIIVFPIAAFASIFMKRWN